jgi:hypothetical protein
MRSIRWSLSLFGLLAGCAGPPAATAPRTSRPIIEADSSGAEASVVHRGAPEGEALPVSRDAEAPEPAVADPASPAEPVEPEEPVEAPSEPAEEVAEAEEAVEAPAPRYEPPWRPDAPVVLPPQVEAHVREVAARVPRRHDAVFIKVGDSATVNRAFMRCLSDDDELWLDGRDELRPTIERIRAARVPGGDSFARDSEAAAVGWSAHLVLRGAPSHLAEEVRATNPRFALVMFGSNDVELGRIARFGTRMTALVDRLLEWGVVPVLSTIPRRNDDPEADREVPRYNALIRALAEGRRVPLVDLERALRALPERGLASDGVHPSAPVVDGRARGCDFTARGLRFGQNVRNLLNLRMLAHLQGVLAREEAPEAPEAPPAAGVERRIDAPRFAVLGDTRGGPRAVDAYPGCGADQDESGPERRYPLRLEAPATVRARVMYEDGVDVDVHLLRRGRCVERGDRAVEAELSPGDYAVVVDTFRDRAGEYLLLVERR